MDKKYISIILYFIVYANIAFAQDQAKVDSLKQIISIENNDTTIIKANIDLGYIFEHIVPDTAMFYYLKAFNLANNALSTFSNNELTQGSLYYKLQSLKAKSLHNIGWIYMNQSHYDKALQYFNDAITIHEKIENKEGIARNLGNLGIVYDAQGNKGKALEYYNKALQGFKEIGDKYGIAINLGYIGSYYAETSNYNKALEYFKNAIANFKEIGDSYSVATYIGNIGLVYHFQNNFEKALDYYEESLKIYKEIGNKYGISSSLAHIGKIYNDKKNYKKALAFNFKALKIAKEIDALNHQSLIYLNLSNSFKELKQYKTALIYQDSFIVMNDSIYNNEKSRIIAEMNARYETEKKEKQIEMQQAELKNSKLKEEKERVEKEKQKVLRNMFIVAFVLMLLLAVYMIRNARQKQRANILLLKQKNQIEAQNKALNQQNEEIIAQRDNIEKQKEIIEKIHHEISDSINYATCLQEAILPENEILEKHLTDHFVLFKPKDKVSGDFYWWAHVENHTVIAAADCTGHGVPGAFMSMLGTSFLREIVQKEYVTHTGVILRKLRKEIIKSLKQKGQLGEQKDGMDMAIISIDHETGVVQFSGANNPLYIITKGELDGFSPNEGLNNFYEIKPDKMPIAIYEKMDNFTSHEIKLQKGDILYMFSDGFADQFGGSQGKKFKYKTFKLLLSDNRDKSMIEQQRLLNTAFESWKGNFDQIDDVVVVGVKL